MSKFGEFLQEYFKENDITIAEFSEQTGFSRSVICHWMYRGSVPERLTRYTLCKRFGYTLEEFDTKLFDDKELPSGRYNKFADAVMEYATKNKLSCREMGAIGGVSRERVLGWMSGICYPKPHTLHEAAKTLGMSDIDCAYLVVSADNSDIFTAMAFILRTIRYSLHFDIKEISALLGVNKDDWIRWESKGATAASKNTGKLSNWLNVSAEYVYGAFRDSNTSAISLSEMRRLYGGALS